MRPWENWQCHTLLVEMQNGIISMERELTISSKIIHSFTHPASNPAFRNLSCKYNGKKNYLTKIPVNKAVDYSLICNSKLKQSKRPVVGG